jgi:hypothetical protein
MYFILAYENRTMKPVEIIVRRGRRDEGMMQGVNLRYVVSTYVNGTMTMYPPVQLSYAYIYIYIYIYI